MKNKLRVSLAILFNSINKSFKNAQFNINMMSGQVKGETCRTTAGDSVSAATPFPKNTNHHAASFFFFFKCKKLRSHKQRANSINLTSNHFYWSDNFKSAEYDGFNPLLKPPANRRELVLIFQVQSQAVPRSNCSVLAIHSPCIEYHLGARIKPGARDARPKNANKSSAHEVQLMHGLAQRFDHKQEPTVSSSPAVFRDVQWDLWWVLEERELNTGRDAASVPSIHQRYSEQRQKAEGDIPQQDTYHFRVTIFP